MAAEVHNEFGFVDTPFYKYATPDVVLVIGEDKTTVNVHEYVLAPQSDFFKAALSNGFKETRERQINLPEIGWRAMSEVLNWLYRAKLWEHSTDYIYEDDMNRVKEVFQAIQFLQIKIAGDEYNLKVDAMFNTFLRDVVNEEGVQRWVKFLNEVYTAGGAISMGHLTRLVTASQGGGYTVYQKFQEAVDSLASHDLDTILIRHLQKACSNVIFSQLHKPKFRAAEIIALSSGIY